MSGGLPLIYEDGKQMKDVIHVRDIVRANLLAMTNDAANYHVFNLGNGTPITVLRMATVMAEKLGSSLAPVFTGQYRAGDARHGWADNSKARRLLGWEPEVSVESGFEDLCRWLQELPGKELETAIHAYEQNERGAEGRRLAV